MECNFFTCLETRLTIGFSQENQLKCTGTAGNNVVHLLNKAKSQSIMNLLNSRPSFNL